MNGRFIQNVRVATNQDHATIRALLDANGLPSSDLETSRPQFIVACEGDVLIGAGALQFFGRSALLRSVVVAATHRSRRVGDNIVRELERSARENEVSLLILLTQTAQEFFERRGYRLIDRKDAPADIQSTAEFRTLCPASAVCMAKTLTAHSQR